MLLQEEDQSREQANVPGIVTPCRDIHQREQVEGRTPAYPAVDLTAKTCNAIVSDVACFSHACEIKHERKIPVSLLLLNLSLNLSVRL